MFVDTIIFANEKEEEVDFRWKFMRKGEGRGTGDVECVRGE